MALRDQPYLPLYVQDYLTDEKLNMCSAATQGVYIKIMCIMHKSEIYGKILLKQKEKQSESNSLNFATKLARLLPFPIGQIHSAIEELVDEKVLQLSDDCLEQKRMIKDCEVSLRRAKAGQKGGQKTQTKTQEFAKAKSEANSENEDGNENINNNNGVEKFNDPLKSYINSQPPKKYNDEHVKLAMDICQYLNVPTPESGNGTTAHFREIRQFIENMELFGKLDNFKVQFRYYKVAWDATNLKKHNYKNFIGNYDQKYDDGKWCSKNWQKEANVSKNTKMTTTLKRYE